MIGGGDDLPEGEAIGVACGWWPSFASPSGAFVKLNGDGSGTIITGAQECGTGAVMGLPILAAEVLGMRPEQFSILSQDTDAGAWDMGASGSQTTFNNGRAVIAAAQEVRDQLLELAAEALEVAAGDLELVDGHARVRGTPSRSVSIPDLAETAHGDRLLLGRGSGTPPPMPDCELGRASGASAWNRSSRRPSSRTRRGIRVDRATGVVRVLEVAAAHDCGVILNPIGAEGQLEGGVLMGIGMALLEGTPIDAEGRQVNPGLLDYKLQTASDAPRIRVEWVDAPSQTGGPKGSKGVGEPPCVPTPGAIANAIAIATGARVHQLPMTPERVWEAMQS